jgi:hypothetical protein
MMRHFTAEDGYPSMAPVTPNEAADAVLAVLPEPTNQAAILREAANRLWAMANRTTERGAGVLWAADWLRRLAVAASGPGRADGEAQQDATSVAACGSRANEGGGSVGKTRQPECTASRSGGCLREAESETACDTEAGECVHGGRPAGEAQQAETQAAQILRRVARWAASSEGRDVLVEELAAAGHRLPHACGNCEGIDPGTCLRNPDRVAAPQPDRDPS